MPNFHLSDTYGLLTKCEVKIAGHWPSSFFACLWTETKSRSINLQKKRGQYPAILTEQTWSIKDLLHGFGENFSFGIQRVVPSGQNGSIFPTWVAKSQHVIWVILPAHGASHIIRIELSHFKCLQQHSKSLTLMPFHYF